MGKRREPRKSVELPVRIFGTDSVGKIFSENVATVDISQTGVKLTGVCAKLKIDEIIGVTYGKNTVHFRVKWLTDSSSSTKAQVGLLSLAPEKRFWDFTVPSGSADTFRPSTDREVAKSQMLHFGGIACSGPARNLGQSFGSQSRRVLRRNTHSAETGSQF